MAEITVEADDEGVYRVEVRDGGSTTSHSVVVPPGEADRLGAGDARDAGEAALVEESFRFLLEREPKESILGHFELPVIARYFPEYPDEIRRRMAARGPQ